MDEEDGDEDEDELVLVNADSLLLDIGGIQDEASGLFGNEEGDCCIIGKKSRSGAGGTGEIKDTPAGLTFTLQPSRSNCFSNILIVLHIITDLCSDGSVD